MTIYNKRYRRIDCIHYITTKTAAFVYLATSLDSLEISSSTFTNPVKSRSSDKLSEMTLTEQPFGITSLVDL